MKKIQHKKRASKHFWKVIYKVEHWYDKGNIHTSDSKLMFVGKRHQALAWIVNHYYLEEDWDEYGYARLELRRFK